MATSKSDIDEISAAVREKRGWFIALGIILIVIGTAAIVSPYIATFTANIFVGWVLLIGGLVQVVHAFWSKDWGGFFWELVVGLIEAAAGAVLLVFPIAGIIALTVYLAAVFAVEGVVRAVLAFQLKPEAGWVWMLIGGIVSVVVGIMLLAKLPSSALWAIGLLVGLNVAVAGWTLFMIGLAAGKKG